MSSIISLTVTLTPATPSSSSQPPPPTSNDSGAMQRGANYFFGFLITFVALLLIFVGYGVGTRRRFAARRRAAWAANFGPWGDGEGSMTDQPQPAFWEPFLTTGGDKWSTMLVSAGLVVNSSYLKLIDWFYFLSSRYQLHCCDQQRKRNSPYETPPHYTEYPYLFLLFANPKTQIRAKLPGTNYLKHSKWQL